MWVTKLSVVLGVVLMVGTASCSRQGAKVVTAHPLAEAYALMDQGKSEKAIILLEDVLKREPENREAKILLASAYVGKAGIDVYSLHDSFQDIIFARPVSDTLWKDSSESPKPAPKQAEDTSRRTGVNKSQSDQPSDQINESKKAAMEKLIDDLDRFLSDLRQKVSFLARFPKISSDKWPLFEESLRLLDTAGNEKDISLYRVFIRIVYVKAFIHEKIIGNRELGTRQWLCQIEVQPFSEELRWVLGHLVLALDDFARAYPDQASALVEIQSLFSGVVESMDIVSKNEGLQTGTAGLILQERLRKQLHCWESKAEQQEGG